MGEEHEISVQRASVIEEFIGLEALVDCVIGVHYLGRLSLAFYHEVLYDEYFSFGLKVRILEKILASDGKAGKETVQRLRRASSIRNIFAHCGVTRYEASAGRSCVPNPRDPEEGIDYGVLYAEYSVSIPLLRDFLLQKAVEKGAKISINKDGTWEEVRPLQ